MFEDFWVGGFVVSVWIVWVVELVDEIGVWGFVGDLFGYVLVVFGVIFGYV